MTEKRKVYFVQASAAFGGSCFLPYSVGCLAAYAWSIPRIAEAYSLERIIYRRENIDSAIDTLESPFLVGFSSYVWNFEYNLTMAKKLRERFPECVIMFGGHDVPLNPSMLDEYGFIDFLIHDEGEEPFSALLDALNGNGQISDIGNISYRDNNGKAVMTSLLPSTRTDYPSPYLSGVFDEMVENDGCEFVATFETNRGCPFKCAYCDWDTLKEGVRQFPIEKIKGEIDWIASHKIEFTWLIDGNFGLFERDESIVDYLVETKNKTGYPKRTNLFYTKNNPEFVFRLNCKLDDAGLSKGACISFQSMCPQVLENIGRSNISSEKFKELMTLYNSRGIPTFTEIIVGLPGETYESFCSGIGQLLDAGQHYSFYVYPCELLKNSAMASEEYIRRFGVKYVITSLNQHHREVPKDEVSEYSRIVVGTDSMSPEMWVKSCLFGVCVRTFHSLGLLQYFAMYLHVEKNIPYASFYQSLLEWMLNNNSSVCGKVFCDLKNRYEKIIDGSGSFMYAFPQFGDVVWPFEEGAFLNIISESEKFYGEIVGFLSDFDIDSDIFDNIYSYQQRMVKTPGNTGFCLDLSYDVPGFISDVVKNKPCTLVKRNVNVSVSCDYIPCDTADFAREIVWYGRKGGKTLFEGDTKIRY